MVEKEMAKLVRTLETRGIDYDIGEGSVSFEHDGFRCLVFPSVDQNGKLCVSFETIEWCDTAEQALMLCGVVGDG